MRRIVAVAFVLPLVVVGSAWAGNLEERNKEIARKMVEAIDAREFAALDEVVATGVRRHSAATPGVVVTNLEEFKEFLRQDLAAVPDAQQEIHLLLAEGNLVAMRAMYRGTQTGAMGPFPPSGKRVEIPFIGILRIEDGKVAEIWAEWDNMAALAQLGHLPPDGEEAGGAE